MIGDQPTQCHEVVDANAKWKEQWRKIIKTKTSLRYTILYRIALYHTVLDHTILN